MQNKRKRYKTVLYKIQECDNTIIVERITCVLQKFEL